MNFSKESALSLLGSSKEYPVDLEDAWQWLGYSSKQSAKKKLIRNFEEGEDFSAKWMSVPHSNGLTASRTETIFLTVDCFKSFAMMAGTEKGRETRQYFLRCEKEIKNAHGIDLLDKPSPQLIGDAVMAVFRPTNVDPTLISGVIANNIAKTYPALAPVAMKEIVAGNLTRYRKGLRLSQEQLADMVGVSRQSINSYENAKTLPDSKSLSALARTLGVAIDDLLRQPSDGLPNFRFRAHAAFGCKPQFAAQVLRVLEDYTALEQAVGLPPYSPENTPCHQLEGNQKRIQTIATQFRHRLGLGDSPILNLFAAVEEIGLKVIRQPIAIENFFGLSACSIEQGAFVLINNQNITIERQLFTLAHEIGHLIFHRGEYQDTLVEEGTKEEEKAREKVADYFAGYLLIPQDEFDRTYKLTKDIVKLKRHFRVSYLAILSRLAEMGEIDFGKEKAKICKIYKNKYGSSLKKSMELPPTLHLEEFTENERYVYLIWQALNMGKISELKAAELLNLTVEELRVHRQENEVYAIA